MKYQKIDKNKQYVEKLYKQYDRFYSPLLLPKIAKHSLNVKVSSILISFISKLKLYDLSIITKQNNLIRLFKIQKSKWPLKKAQVKSYKGSKQENLSNDRKQIQKQSQFEGRENSLQKSQQNKKQHHFIGIYKQLYQYVRIMLRRMGDLQQFIQILKKLNIYQSSLQKTKDRMMSQISEAKTEIQGLFGSQSRITTDLNQQDKYKDFGSAISRRRNCNNYFQMYKQSRINQKASKNHRIKTEKQENHQVKFRFLKRRQSRNMITRPSNIEDQTRTSNQPNKEEFLTNQSQVSYNLNDRKQVTSRNTQQKYDEDLELEQDDIMFQASKTIKQEFSSKKELYKNTLLKQNRITSWHKLQNQHMKTADQNKAHQLKTRQQNRNSQATSPTLSVTQNNSRQKENSIFTKRKSKINANPQTVSNNKMSSFRLQNNLSSRSSFKTQNSHANAIHGMKRNKNSKLKDQFDARNSKIYNEQTRTRKIRYGTIKKGQLRFSDDQQKTLSINDDKMKQVLLNQKVKNRRNGKRIAIQMNSKFQRIIQDQNIQQIIQSNQEKEHKVIQSKKDKNLKSMHNRAIRRIRKGTQTSIGQTRNSQFGQQQLKSTFRVPKPKQNPIDRQMMLVNYSDLLMMQKNLKLISTYNEAKMLARYSYEKENDRLQTFQFKYKNGRLQFNHQFYLRTQEQNREKDHQEALQRTNQVKLQNSRIDFMSRFKKCLQNYEQPIQSGYDQKKYQIY